MKMMRLVKIGAATCVLVGLVFTCAQQKPMQSAAPAGSRTAQEANTHPEVDFSMGCVECHRSMTPAVVSTWKASLHGQTNVKCYLCHGDGQEEFHPMGDDSGCTGCHAAQTVDFASRPEVGCFDCHNGHTLKFHTGD